MIQISKKIVTAGYYGYSSITFEVGLTKRKKRIIKIKKILK